jgi:hypothetical protein
MTEAPSGTPMVAAAWLKQAWDHHATVVASSEVVARARATTERLDLQQVTTNKKVRDDVKRRVAVALVGDTEERVRALAEARGCGTITHPIEYTFTEPVPDGGPVPDGAPPRQLTEGEVDGLVGRRSGALNLAGKCRHIPRNCGGMNGSAPRARAWLKKDTGQSGQGFFDFCPARSKGSRHMVLEKEPSNWCTA